MNTEKGMSQILVLIVAAAVLMMVGLLLITLSSDSISGVFQDTNAAACESQLQAECRASGSDTIPSGEYPSTCETDGSVIDGINEDEFDCDD